tara:strand:- start:41 stop:625 length:585 start_codon:yes stop_codon:yes gene_type:complete
MKTFLTLLLFLFSSSVVAEDVSDFEIEGMSIGDSLLDYMSEKEIKNNIVEIYQYYNNQDFTTVQLSNHRILTQYDGLQINIKRKDQNYIIYALYGGIHYTNKDIEECYNDMKKIDRDISNLFNNLEKVGPEKQIHQADPSGDSTYTGIYNYFPSDSTISVECYDWSNKITKEKNWVDNLRISISSKEFNDWLWQ